jgi:hypothetical protein
MASRRIYNPDRIGNRSQSAKPFNPLTSLYNAFAEADSPMAAPGDGFFLQSILALALALA